MKLAGHHILTGSEVESELAQHSTDPAQSVPLASNVSGKFASQFLFIFFHTLQYVGQFTV